MTNGPTYVLDANVFIQAARRYYAFDVAPRFWDGLVQHAANGQVWSIDRVLKELDRGKDELAAWANNNLSDAFISTDEPGVIQVYSDIMVWVQTQSQFTDAAKTDSASGADGWLVAYAKVRVVSPSPRRFLILSSKGRSPFRMCVKPSARHTSIHSTCSEG